MASNRHDYDRNDLLDKINFISELEKIFHTAATQCEDGATKVELERLTDLCKETIRVVTYSDRRVERVNLVFAFTAQMALVDKNVLNKSQENLAELVNTKLFKSKIPDRPAGQLSNDERAFCIWKLQGALEDAKSNADADTKLRMEVVQSQALNMFCEYQKMTKARDENGALTALKTFAKAMVSVNLAFNLEEEGFGTDAIENWFFEPVSIPLSKPSGKVSLEDKAYFLAQLQAMLKIMSWAARVVSADRYLVQTKELAVKVRNALDTYRAETQNQKKTKAKAALMQFAKDTADVDTELLDKVQGLGAEVFEAWRKELLKQPTLEK